MIANLFPDQYLESVHDIDYDALMCAGIKNLIFDIDNTLAPFDVAEPYPKTVGLFGGLRAQGFKICLLSNNSYLRVQGFNAPLDVAFVARAHKPAGYGLERAMALIDASRHNTALIGDQIFTDVWCANRNGLVSILVKPIAARDEFTVKLKRRLERYVINLYLRSKKRSQT